MERFKGSNYPRGSEWRRWDLHVHTPESRLGGAFTGVSWEAYVSALEAAARDRVVSVIGVTDYMSVDGYEKLLAAKNDPLNPRLESVDLLIPNIELRALPATTDNKALNIHVLVDPTDPAHLQRIQRALRNLRVSHGSETYGCCRDELIEYGKILNPSLKEDDAYWHGIAQFKPSYETIEKWLSTEGWLKCNSMIGVANGKDGISGLPLDGFSATREQLLKQADFVFSGNPNDRLHYLGKKPGISEKDIIRMYRSLKPCLHGSDAHDIEKLFAPDGDRFCWIKADPTFEGLKQVLWEPEARVTIGAMKPQVGDRTRVIGELRIRNIDSWFASKSIPLNDGLVAIIGEKGAGKTAIADLTAFAAGAPVSRDSQSSFIAKGRLHLEGGQVELLWADNSTTRGQLSGQPYPTAKPLVRYLSQDFVERLCTTDNEGHELQDAIEEVVFSHLNETSREGYSSFEQLRASREAASQSRQDSARGDLASLHREVERLLQAIGQRPQKIAFKEQTDVQIEGLRKQLPEVELLADKAVLQDLDREQKSLAMIEGEVSSLSRRRRSIDDLLKNYISVKERTTKQIQELAESAQSLGGLPSEVAGLLQPTWDRRVEETLSAASVELTIQIDRKKGAEEAVTDGSVVAAKAKIRLLQEQLSKDEVNRSRLLELQKQIAENEAISKRIAREIADLDGKTTKQLIARQNERDEVYASYFQALATDGKGLEELYAPMKAQLEALGPEMRFELSSGYRVDVKTWLEGASRFFDGRRPTAMSKKDEVEKFVIDSLAPAWKSGDKSSVASAFSAFYKLVDPVSFMADLASPSLKMIDLFDWMYSTDHIGISYKILYGGTEIEYLSPGTRGIALLVLYLLMDEDDRRPLIIDQPEGNLDNASVFSQLVPYIRRAKEKRQIILVTHNPNLVVATDAEQVIVATAERPDTQSYPRISYRSGALEDSRTDTSIGVRQAVCTLLEGGETAFKAREGRYSIRA